MHGCIWLPLTLAQQRLRAVREGSGPEPVQLLYQATYPERYHRTVVARASDLFNDAERGAFTPEAEDRCETVERNGGRTERRTCTVLGGPACTPWSGCARNVTGTGPPTARRALLHFQPAGGRRALLPCTTRLCSICTTRPIAPPPVAGRRKGHARITMLTRVDG